MNQYPCCRASANIALSLFRWYMTFVMMAAEMRLGVNFPVGDLSHFWPKTDVTLGEAEKQA